MTATTTTTAVTAPARRPTLYQFGADLAALDDLLYECGGDVTDPAVCAAVEAWQNELHAGRAEKLDGVWGYLRQNEMEIAALGEDIAAATAKKRSRQARSDAVKAMVRVHMDRAGERTLTSAKGVTFRVVGNGGAAPLLVPDADRVPVEFLKTTVSVDNDKIRAALAAGAALDFAALDDRGNSLRIKS